MEKTSTKIVLNSQEDFNRELEIKKSYFIFEECKKQGSLEITKKIETKAHQLALESMSSTHRVKGTRTGHINSAPAEVLTMLDDINNQLLSVPHWESVDKNGNVVSVYVSTIVKVYKD